MRKLLAQLLLGLALTQPALSQTIGAPGGGGGGGGSGTVTSVGTGTGLSGGPITTTGTINCVQGSASVLGCVEVDGTTITATAGVIKAVGPVASVAGGCGATPTSPQTGTVVIQANESPLTPQTTGNIGTGVSATYCGNLVNYNSASDQTPNLPTSASAGAGAFFTLCNVGTHSQTVTHAGSDTIGITGAATTYSLAAGTVTAPSCVTFVADGGTVWAISNPPGSGGSGITALTGDVTASGSGSVAATVAAIAGVAVGTPTGTGNVVFSAAPTLSGAPFLGASPTATSFGLTGNISAAAWTTSGIRYKNVAATLTDTSSSGTVATVYNDVWGGNTNAASSATTYTNLYGSYFKAPIAGTNVTLTNKFALGADSINVTGITYVNGNGTSQGTPSIRFAGTADTNGIWTGSHAIQFGDATNIGPSVAVQTGGSTTNGLVIRSGGFLAWVSTGDPTATPDTTTCRSAAAVVEIGGSTCGATGALIAASFISGGSAPTLTGTCTTGSQVGGNTAGTFTATCVSQTVIITFSFTAAHGWACNAHDLSTPADALNQTSSSTTSCTLTGTTVASDVISFNAMAF